MKSKVAEKIRKGRKESQDIWIAASPCDLCFSDVFFATFAIFAVKGFLFARFKKPFVIGAALHDRNQHRL